MAMDYNICPYVIKESTSPSWYLKTCERRETKWKSVYLRQLINVPMATNKCISNDSRIFKTLLCNSQHNNSFSEVYSKGSKQVKGYGATQNSHSLEDCPKDYLLIPKKQKYH